MTFKNLILLLILIIIIAAAIVGSYYFLEVYSGKVKLNNGVILNNNEEIANKINSVKQPVLSEQQKEQIILDNAAKDYPDVIQGKIVFGKESSIKNPGGKTSLIVSAKVLASDGQEYSISPDFSKSTYEYWGIKNNDNVKIRGKITGQNNIEVVIINKI
jgi:hypothetical protein